MMIYLEPLVLLYFWQASSLILACGPVQRPTPNPVTGDQDVMGSSAQARLDDVIRRAYTNITGDKITLIFPPDTSETTRNTRTTLEKAVVKRPSVGRTVSFVCETFSANASAVVTWTHQGNNVYQSKPSSVNCSTSTHQYDVLNHGQITILSIINVSFASSGEVACYEQSNATNTLLKRYSLNPDVYRAADVFAMPMPNWSIRMGSGQAFYCHVRLILPAHMIKRADELYIWRHNNRTVVAPDAPPYTLGALSTPTKTLYEINGHKYSVRTSTFSFRMRLVNADVSDSGSVECWFRANPDIHEWFIQSGSLVVHRPA